MNDAVLVFFKFLGSGAFATLCLFVYTRIKNQAAESESLKKDVKELQDDRDEMKQFFEKVNNRFDIVATRLGELSGNQKDQAKDIEQLRQNDRKFEDTVGKIYDKQDQIFKVVTELRIEMAKNERK